MYKVVIKGGWFDGASGVLGGRLRNRPGAIRPRRRVPLFGRPRDGRNEGGCTTRITAAVLGAAILPAHRLVADRYRMAQRSPGLYPLVLNRRKRPRA